MLAELAQCLSGAECWPLRQMRRAICVNHTDTPAVRTVERNGKTHEQKAADMTRPVGCLPNRCALVPRPPEPGPEQLRDARSSLLGLGGIRASCLQIAYKHRKRKNPATVLIAGFPYVAW